MPKKTKKEKIIALYRRKLKLLKEAQTSLSPKEKSPSPEILITKTIKEESKPIIEEKQTVFFFSSDLRKSLIWASVVITLEILLYFVRIIK